MAGMSMPTADAAPSATATMVCGAEIKTKVKMALSLMSTPITTSTWSGGLFTCTYRLPVGPMRLSVQQSTDKAAARAYFTAVRARLGHADDLIGLGDAAYATTTGTAVVVKDDMTLQVDTTALPAIFGAQRQKRTDLAYEIASDVLGCWTGG